MAGAPYKAMRVAAGGEVVLEGAFSRFASGSVAVLPVAGAQPLYAVYWRANAGRSIRIQAPADWRGDGAKRGRVVVALSDGSQLLYALAREEAVPADAQGPAGVLLTAEKGAAFPSTIVSAGPAGRAPEGEVGLEVSMSLKYEPRVE